MNLYLIISLVLATFIIIIQAFLNLPLYLFVVLIILAFTPYLIYMALKLREIEEIESEFPNFLRDLSFYIETGMSLPKALQSTAQNYYGKLSNYIKRIVAQIHLGLPFSEAMERFASKIDSLLIKRAVATFIEAEKSGGDPAKTLISVSLALQEINNLLKERESETRYYNFVFYIIFIGFVLASLILRKILIDFSKMFNSPLNISDFDDIILTTIIINAFFTGLVIGKVTKGSFYRGLIHSIILIGSSIAIYKLFSIFI